MKRSIYPCLWFDTNARQAADYYCTVFNDTGITADNGMVVSLELLGEKMMLLNGGPYFQINPAISFFLSFNNEEEVDAAWQKLTSGGSVLMPLDKYPWSPKYGWVQDMFGVSWQLWLGDISDVGQKVCPMMMFTQEHAGKAEQAINFYTSIFDNSSVKGIARYEKGEGDVEGYVKHGQFIIDDYVMMAMDSSADHKFSFNEAVSIVVECDDQKEIDYFWQKLSSGGSEQQCGWLKDQFGVSWQIVPAVLKKLMTDPGRAERVIKAFMKMKKFDIEALEMA
jgi:predicted 3-demethylubiquinone-9 3-methyltransferase (glyoxalase superfamily)